MSIAAGQPYGTARMRWPAPLFSSDAGQAASALQEIQQVGVDLVLEGRAHAVRRALVDFQLRALDDLDESMDSSDFTAWHRVCDVPIV